MARPRIGEPSHSCPDIDRAIRSLDDGISLLNEIRQINEKLREWGKAYEEYAEELEDENLKLEEQISDLEESNNTLTVELAELKQDCSIH